MIISLLLYLIISNALNLRKDKSILFSRIVMVSLILASYITYNNLNVIPISKGIGLYGGLLHVTPNTISFNIFVFILTSVILIFTSFYPRKVWVKQYTNLNQIISGEFTYNKNEISNKFGEQFKITEYPLIMVFVITGGIFLMSTADLIPTFLSIELQSYGLYIISSIYRDSEKATNGGLTYFLLGGLSSCFILLGSALIYINSGTTSLDGIYLISSISNVLPNDQNWDGEILLNTPVSLWYQPYYIHLSLIILSVGFLFKISAAPFHFWSPDVYDAIPTIVTTFVAIIAKLSIFIFFLELVYYTDESLYGFTWTNVLLISSLLSLIVGSVLGLTQFRIKRLFAYSTISHLGFILLGLSINSIESMQAYIFYIITYTISNLNAFIILIAIGYTYYMYMHKDEKKYQENKTYAKIGIQSKVITKDNTDLALTEINNSPIQLISQIKGYFYINPYLGLSLGITLFSFVGVPPLVGFFAKQMVLSAALDNGYVFMSLVAILTSVIGAVYYLNVIKNIFFFKSEYVINEFLTDIVLKGRISYKLNKTQNSVSQPSRVQEALNHKNFISPTAYNQNKYLGEKVSFGITEIVLNSALSTTISILTLILLGFIYIPNEWFNIANILTLLLFKP